MTIHCRVIAFLSADTSRDLLTLTFVLLTLNRCHTCRVKWPTLPPSLKTPRISVLELLVITFPVGSHLKRVRGHCACAELRYPCVGGQKRLHCWNPRSRFAYSLYNFYWAPTTIKGRLFSSRPMLKPFFCEKISLVETGNGAKNGGFGKMGVQILDTGFATRKRHFLARNRVVLRILRQNRCARLGCSLFQEPPPPKIAESLCADGREITHAQNRNP